MPIRTRHLLLITLLIPCALWADNPYDTIRYNRAEEYKYDDSKDVPWKEETGGIPTTPDTNKMLEVPIDNLGDEFVVLLEPTSLTIGKDGVLRYWVSLRSKLGSVNTMYEGMRCDTHEYKTYAYASQREPGKLQAMTNSKWLSTKSVRGRSFRFELDQQFFCNFGTARTQEEIAGRLKEANRSLFSVTKERSGPAAFY